MHRPDVLQLAQGRTDVLVSVPVVAGVETLLSPGREMTLSHSERRSEE